MIKGDKKMAPLQKRALYSLAIGLVLTIILVAVLVAQGDITAFDNNQNIRLVMYVVFVGVPIINLILMDISLRKPTQLDERDRLIMQQSIKTQWLAIIFTLVAWIISLTEIYHDQGQVPIAYLNLIFVSILIISTLAQSLGVLIGYWSLNRNV
jgi:hypothetical protein